MGSLFSASPGVWVFRAILILALAACAVWAKGRIDMSYETAALKDKVSALSYHFRHEQERRVEAERFARAVQLKLEGAEAMIAGRAKDAAKKATALVPKSSVCDYSSDVVSMLNRARGYDP